jgi:hypothetical protein
MASLSYEDSPYPVRSDLKDAHERFWNRLAGPGTWWTSAERIAIAQASREARNCRLCRERKSALSPYGLDGTHDGSTDLSPSVVDVVHRITTDAARLTRQWYEAVLAAGLSEGQYVELVGTIVSMVSIDAFSRALGLSLRVLPDPTPEPPSQYRPETAALEDQAWVPMVPECNEGTPEADLWPSERTGNVIRAMSLVPDEVRTLSDLSAAHYLPNAQVRDPMAAQGELDRLQMELVAGRVSALEGCFY